MTERPGKVVTEEIVLNALKVRTRDSEAAHRAAAAEVRRRAWWGLGLAVVVSSAGTGALFVEAIASFSSWLQVGLGGLTALWGVALFYLERYNAEDSAARPVAGPPASTGPAVRDPLARLTEWLHHQEKTWLGAAQAGFSERVMPRLKRAVLVVCHVGLVVWVPLMLLLWLVSRIGLVRVVTTLLALGVSALLVAAAWRLSALAAAHEAAGKANEEFSHRVEEARSPRALSGPSGEGGEGDVRADRVRSLQALGAILEALAPPVPVGPSVPGKGEGSKHPPAAAPLRARDLTRIEGRVTALVKELGLTGRRRAVRKAIRAYARRRAERGGYPVITDDDVHLAALVVWRSYLFWPLVRDKVVSQANCDPGWADRAVGLYRYELGTSTGFDPDVFFRQTPASVADATLARVRLGFKPGGPRW